MVILAPPSNQSCKLSIFFLKYTFSVLFLSLKNRLQFQIFWNEKKNQLNLRSESKWVLICSNWHWTRPFQIFVFQSQVLKPNWIINMKNYISDCWVMGFEIFHQKYNSFMFKGDWIAWYLFRAENIKNTLLFSIQILIYNYYPIKLRAIKVQKISMPKYIVKTK